MPHGAALREPQATSVTYAAQLMPAMAWRDLVEGFANHGIWLTFAIFDIRQRFKRSMLGPLWFTISMGVMVLALTLVFGTIFNQSIEELVPYIATGLIFWGLITAIILEGGQAFVSAEGFIRSVPMPLSTHFYRMFVRNLIIWCFNMVIYAGVWLILIRSVSINHLLFPIGFLLLLVNLTWMGMVVAVVSTRYRDIPQIVASAIQVIFFVTPIFWSVELLPQRPAFVVLNPFFHLIEIVRAPLLGVAPHGISWLVCAVLPVIGLPFAWYLYRRGFPRIAYWI